MKIHFLFPCCLVIFLLTCQSQPNEEYVCEPCDLACDTLVFSTPGTCPECGMSLIKKSELELMDNLVVGEIDMQTGSGVFLVEGGIGRTSKPIAVHYHKPKTFQPTSKILLVLPGAGRDGDEYRDSWVEAAEQYSILVLSPSYPDSSYAFEDYHLCGVMRDLNLESSITYVENTNIANLDEQKFSFQINPSPEQWIFSDFDRIVGLAAEASGSEQTTYDVFGHSAGGQILHRMAIFYPFTKADRVIAANAGFYTLPDRSAPLPFGTEGIPVDLEQSFQQKLILLIGELDNEDETGGTLLRSPSADRQGLHRLERGKYFYSTSKTIAAEAGLLFRWQLEIIPGIGHDFEKMAAAAVHYLYETEPASEQPLQ